MIKELCLHKSIICVHSITPKGGAGKSIYNNQNIDIYERFDYNLNYKKALSTSIVNENGYKCKTFGPQGLILYDAKVNNVNRCDAGSYFNDKSGLCETIEGIQNPKLDQVIDEINASQGGYVEVNIYNPTFVGFFLNLYEISWMEESIRSYSEFYSRTRHYELPYYGIVHGGIIRIKEDNLEFDRKNHIGEGTLMTVKGIYECCNPR